MALAENINGFFADFGVPAVFGIYSANVIFDRPDVDIFSGIGIAADYAIHFSTIALPGIKRGDSVTVSGNSYNVIEVRVLDDGAISVAGLEKL